jgi:UDP-N-acetylglucosamine 2-epimerase (non-hydrolysing)
MNIISVVGARPNFIKIAPIIQELNKHCNIFNHKLVHTGQHYDNEMSGIFFNDFNLPEPHIRLGVGSGTHAEQTAEIMVRFEKVCISEKPDLVLVVGDVNSTLACSVVCSKLTIPVAHIEAGLRNFDRTMPEEINRIVTDALSDYLFTTCQDANENLKREGISEKKVYFVGNAMIDTLKLLKQKTSEQNTLQEFGLEKQEYAILTLHRPSNVDDRNSFERILKAMKAISCRVPILFPAHPRTKKQIELFSLQKYFSNSNIKLVNPFGYLSFLNLMMSSKFALTDSGGIQEETTVLNIPCLTLRKNTERPVTITQGTNTIVGNDTDRIIQEANKIIDGIYKQGTTPKLWEGKSAERIVKVLIKKRDELQKDL